MKVRRIFYIDVGNLPKDKAEDYIKQLVENYKHQLSPVEEVVAIATRDQDTSRVESMFVPETSEEVLELARLTQNT